MSILVSWKPYSTTVCSVELLSRKVHILVIIMLYTLLRTSVNIAFGDYYYKLPKIYTYKVFLNSAQLFKLQAKVETVIGRSITPPYLSAVPDVKHVDLASLNIDDAFLILCSDGLINLSDDRLFLKEKLAPYWVNTVASAQELDSDNLALALLREGLGGDDMEKVSRHLTVEMESRWVDDTTILIQQLGL